MKKDQKTRKIISVIALCLVLCMCFTACGSPAGNNNSSNSSQNTDTPVVRPSSPVSALNYTQEEIVKMANKSKNLLELMEALFPDYGVAEGEDGVLSFTETGGVTDGEKEVLKVANKSRTVIEFLSFLYPDRAIYRDDDDGYILEPLREYLQKNSYNWADLSRAIKGIDVSKWQENINWSQVAASDVGFVFVRVGYRGYVDGSIVKDEFFDTNMHGAINSNIPVGVYFASKARNIKEAEEEARWLVEQIRPYSSNISWPVVLDVEIQDETDRVSNLDIETRTNNVLAALSIIKEAGYTPMIYSNPRVLIARLDYTKLAEYSKWIAEYQNQPHYPYYFQIWQASESGTVAGIEGEVDINYSIVDFGAQK